MIDDITAKRRLLIKRVAIIAVLVIVLLIIVVTFAANALIFVNVTQKSGTDPVSVTIVADGSKRGGGVGLQLIPRSTSALIISSGISSSTIVPVSVPLLGIATVDASLEPSKSVTDVAFETAKSVCATYQKDTDSMLGYDCGNATQLTRFESNGTSSKVASLSYVANQVLPPYAGGVIGVADVRPASSPQLLDTKPVSVIATNANGSQAYAAPDGVTSEGLSGLRLFTDSTDTSNTRFVMADAFGTVYLAVPSDDKKTIKYKRVEAPENYNYLYNQTLCTLSGDTVYCYRGRTSAKPEKDAKYEPATLSKLSFDEGAVDTSPVSGLDLVNGFYSTSSGSLYGRSGSRLVAIDKKPTAYEPRVVVDGVGVVSGGDALYFSRDERIYMLDKSTNVARQVAALKDTVPRGLYYVDANAFVFTTQKDGTIVSAHKIDL